jgi:DNA helicase-2/ATP-dependent DNA helicase PcrA
MGLRCRVFFRCVVSGVASCTGSTNSSFAVATPGGSRTPHAISSPTPIHPSPPHTHWQRSGITGPAGVYSERMFDPLQALNGSQRQAATHGEGPLLIVAGAGTGKTLTLACRVAHLLKAGTPPERILLLTFTRRAAREMLARAGRMIGPEATSKVWGGTFHAVANRLLRRYGRPIGIVPAFTILDQADGADLMDLVRSELGLDTGKRRFPKKDTLAAIYSRTVNAGERLRLVLDRDFPWCTEESEGIREIFGSYVERKRRQNLLDYDDLLLYWNALSRAPGVGDRVGRLFDHILVDEYQDTNPLQADILQAMRRDVTNLTVVGDDAQAIYSFRSATVRNILEFPQRFPGTTVVKLEQNYRSTEPLLEASNAVIRLSPQRHDKTLWSARGSGARPLLVTCLDESEQSDAVCRSVLEHREQGTLLRHQAVLFRAAHHSDLLEVELGRRNIPFVKYGGLKFLESAHVKDVLALLRILENPRDEVSWFRILQLAEGVGPATARRLVAEMGVVAQPADAGPMEPASPLRRFIEGDLASLPEAAGPEVGELRRTLAECVQDLPPAAQIERIRRFLEPVFVRRYSSPRERLRDVEQLEHLASGYPTRARFVADLTLDPPASTADLAGPPLLDEDYLILSTIHSAKGGEWDAVHVIHAADGMIPSDMATGHPEQIEEERRLFYVAMTRARNDLTVYFPLRYYRRPRGLDDVHAYAQVTRFLPPEVRRAFDERCTFAPDHPDDPALGEASVPTRGAVSAARRVDQFLAGLWAD